jgi:hypothetical protein
MRMVEIRQCYFGSLVAHFSSVMLVRNDNTLIISLRQLIAISGQPISDGTSFAAYEDIIVVTANYRTNGEGSFHLCSLVSNKLKYSAFQAHQSSR